MPVFLIAATLAAAPVETQSFASVDAAAAALADEVQTGTLLFSKGDCLAIKVYTNSPYTHVAAVVVQDGAPYVYDSQNGAGVRRLMLNEYLRAQRPERLHVHHPREPLEMQGGTTFHFLDASPAEALKVAQEAAGGQDVRIGGGATVVREFVAAGLVDLMHLVQVPIVLGHGVRVWDGLEALEDTFDIEAVSTPSGVTHLTFTRKTTS